MCKERCQVDGGLRGSHAPRRELDSLESLHTHSLEEVQKHSVWWLRTPASGTVQATEHMFILDLYGLFSICSP